MTWELASVFWDVPQWCNPDRMAGGVVGMDRGPYWWEPGTCHTRSDLVYGWSCVGQEPGAHWGRPSRFPPALSRQRENVKYGAHCASDPGYF